MLRSLVRLWGTSGPERVVKTAAVDPPNVVQSQQGRYFVGRTGLFQVAGGHQALVLFRTLPESSRRTFVVSITVTSNQGRRAFFYFGAQTPWPMRSSPKVASAHRGAGDKAESTIQIGTGTTVPLSAGVSVCQRLLAGGDTLVLEQQGRIILEPGEGIGVWFDATPTDDDIDVAFGWWEEPLD